MKNEFTKMSLTLGLLCALNGVLISGDKEEHRGIAKHALFSILTECKDDSLHALVKFLFQDGSLTVDKKLWQNKSFGEISALFSSKDISLARCHEPRRTILQQLESLPLSLLNKLLDHHTSATNIESAEQSNKNVVVNYLLHHLIALRYADRAGRQSDKEVLRTALVYEAMAISYLTDAFSSGHMLLSLDKPFASQQTRNFREAHDSYGRKGLYVINSEGKAWQTFGDKLMQWYEPTHRHVLEAGVTSLRELLLVFHAAANPEKLPRCLESWAQSAAGHSTILHMVEEWLKPKDGRLYYVEHRLPSLLLLPMPISAAWSVRTDDEIGTSGLHRRFHYPQLADSGYFDPDLPEFNKELLLPQTGVPDWLKPDVLGDDPNPEETKKLIKRHPDIASVRYTQETDFPPSFKGVLFHFGTGFLLENGNDINLLSGLGYGLFDDWLLINNFSVDFLFMDFFTDPDRQLLTANFGAGIKLPKFLKLFKAARLEGGPAARLNSNLKLGYRIAAGLELPVWPLRFTYAGVISRLMFQRMDIGTTSNGLYLQVILH